MASEYITLDFVFFIPFVNNKSITHGHCQEWLKKTQGILEILGPSFFLFSLPTPLLLVVVLLLSSVCMYILYRCVSI